MSTVYIQRKSAVKSENISGSIVDTTNVINKLTNTYSARVIDMLINIATPVGSGMDYYGTEAPLNYMFADGRAISRVKYAELFKIIGTTYGAGDGSTTFNLPDKRERVSISTGSEDWYLGKTGGSIQHNHTQASTTGGTAITVNQMPSHSHRSLMWGDNSNQYFGVNSSGSPAGMWRIAYSSGDSGVSQANFYTNRIGGGQAHTHSLGSTNSAYALPPYLVCNYIIKVSSENQSIDDLLTEALERSY